MSCLVTDKFANGFFHINITKNPNSFLKSFYHYKQEFTKKINTSFHFYFVLFHLLFKSTSTCFIGSNPKKFEIRGLIGVYET